MEESKLFCGELIEIETNDSEEEINDDSYLNDNVAGDYVEDAVDTEIDVTEKENEIENVDFFESKYNQVNKKSHLKNCTTNLVGSRCLLEDGP